MSVTEYYKEILKYNDRPIIPFKDGDFIISSIDELYNNDILIEINHKLCTILNDSEKRKLFEKMNIEYDYEKTVEKDCAIAYKSLITNFNKQSKTKEEIADLTGVLYLIINITFKRKFLFKEDKDTVVAYFSFNKKNFDKKISNCIYVADEFVYPNYTDRFPCVTTNEKLNTFLTHTTDYRAKIDNWVDFIKYAEYLYMNTFDKAIEYENNIYIFNYKQAKTTLKIEDLYKCLSEELININVNLYEKITTPNFESIKTINSVDGSIPHRGQMTGLYPLAQSQREAVNTMGIINSSKSSEVLAVSGPPGTGKTTLLQSVVASMLVTNVLNNDINIIDNIIDENTKFNPLPIIVATSTNNQAVTNIIDSFSKIPKVGIDNLEERWIDGVDSFATYLPSDTKRNEAKSKIKNNEAKLNNYQYTSIKDREFIQNAENIIDSSKTKMINSACKYYNTELTNIYKVMERLFSQLKNIDINRCALLKCIEDIKQYKGFISNNNVTDYVSEIKELKSRKEKLKNSTDKYYVRLKEWEKFYKDLSIWEKLFSSFKSYKIKLKTKILEYCTDEERNNLSDEIKFIDVQELISKWINNNNELIKEIENSIAFFEEQLKIASDIIVRLSDNKCYIPILNDKKTISEFIPSKIIDYIDTKVRYIEFWLAVHINECRFLNREYILSWNAKGCTFQNCLENFYNQIALISPCFVMTFFTLPDNFKCFISKKEDIPYLYNFIDLLIVDEAGQCSPEIASASFSLAKQAIVVGDEMQIPPVYNIDIYKDLSVANKTKVIINDDICSFFESGISASQGNIMRMAKNACNYKSNDFDRGLFLSEHRRCYDNIISYCNDLVYNGQLIPMRNKDEINADKTRVLDETIYPLMGYYNIPTETSTQMTNGTSRYNKEEADGIAKWLNENFDNISNQYKNKDMDIDMGNIIAVITPFKAQVSVIRQSLKTYASKFYRNISVGTVHTFQGAERKVIIFSTVYGARDNCKFIDNNKNLMNVAVSRAKDAFWVFGSIKCLSNKDENNASGLLNKFISENEIK